MATSNPMHNDNFSAAGSVDKMREACTSTRTYARTHTRTHTTGAHPHTKTHTHTRQAYRQAHTLTYAHLSTKRMKHGLRKDRVFHDICSEGNACRKIRFKKSTEVVLMPSTLILFKVLPPKQKWLARAMHTACFYKLESSNISTCTLLFAFSCAWLHVSLATGTIG